MRLRRKDRCAGRCNIRKLMIAAAASASPMIALPGVARATIPHFDYTSFQTGFGQSQFDVLNYPSINGQYMMTSTDAHRPEMVANNNDLAEFYNNFLADYNTQYNSANGLDAAAEAFDIDQYTINHSNSNGPKPTWLILNELSASVWPDTAQKGTDYRNWVIDTVSALHDTYGYTVVTYSPFANPGAHSSDWQALAAKSYIGVENYLSGAEVMAHGTDYASREAWAQAQYDWSQTAFGNLGVDSSRLFLGEEFANTKSGTGWGRAGISADDWDEVIQIRQDAIKNAGYAGFLAYAWGSNDMGISTAEMIQHELWYRTRLVMDGQAPQWLADDAYTIGDAATPVPLSWSQELNWLGGIPNANGSVVNFYKTISANRTVTLDGSKTVGSLTFNSGYTYTIAQGSGGSMIFQNNGSAAPITISSGNANISAPVQVIDPLSINLSSSTNLTFSGAIDNSAGKAITKSGSGFLNLNGPQTHGVGASLTVSSGSVFLNSDAGAGGQNLSVTLPAGSGLSMNSTQHLKSLSIASTTATMSANGSHYLQTAGLTITGSGKLNLNDNDLIVEYSGASPFTQIQNWVTTGYSDTFNPFKTGIISTTGQQSGGTTMLMLFDNALVGASEWPIGSGNPVPTDSVLGKYTYFGDTNLDGQVTAADYNAVDAGLGATGLNPGVALLYGDTNFDNSVNAADYNAIDAGLGLGVGNPLAASSVPEPAMLGLIASGLLLLRRRRRGGGF